ncbi:MAG TPA: hypothetical protein VFY20_09260 [Gemmatimonadales bacterium]|nr:hypothetical protein [Gemmatimonadales bacterium]
MPVPPLATLLAGLVDYAGLFPPAALDMPDAVREYAGYRRGTHAWMLGRFVLPVARLGEFAQAADPLLPRDPKAAWPLAVLASADPAETVKLVGEFNCRHAAAGAGAAVVDTLELKASTPAEIAMVVPKLPTWLVPYVEIPLADPAPFIEALAVHGGRAKARTGGIAASAFPTAAEVARFIVACTKASVPFKATAGLHHPLRGEFRLTYEPGSPSGMMFGFLNVFLAAALARTGAEERDVASLLEERDPSAITFATDGVRWRHHLLSTDVLRAAREAAIAFGSCSFREPVDDLTALGLL